MAPHGKRCASIHPKTMRMSRNYRVETFHSFTRSFTNHPLVIRLTTFHQSIMTRCTLPSLPIGIQQLAPPRRLLLLSLFQQFRKHCRLVRFLSVVFVGIVTSFMNEMAPSPSRGSLRLSLSKLIQCDDQFGNTKAKFLQSRRAKGLQWYTISMTIPETIGLLRYKVIRYWFSIPCISVGFFGIQTASVYRTHRSTSHNFLIILDNSVQRTSSRLITESRH